jgi:hypothetical protein
MNVCAGIHQSTVVDVPIGTADAEWMAFTLWNIYNRSLDGPDEIEDERDPGLVRLQDLDDNKTRVTVDLNYCPQYQGISDPEVIARLQQHLRATLAHYKEFIESSSLARPDAGSA